MSFHMPASWYDPPEYAFQKQAEEIYDKNLFGFYEVDKETGKIIHYDLVPDNYGTKEEMEMLLESALKSDPDLAGTCTVEPLSFEACCEMAESLYDNGSSYYDDYEYDSWKEAEPYDDYDY